MVRWPPRRRDVIAALAAEILTHYRRGRVLVAVDAPEGAEADDVARELAAAFEREHHPAVVASIEDFQQPREHRLRRGSDSGEGRYRDRYDYSALRRVLVEPFRLGGSTGFQTLFFDRRRDAPFESSWRTAGEDSVLIVAGPFLQRPELRGLWHYAIRLELPAEEAWARRAPEPPDEDDAEAAAEAARLYERESAPRERANAIIGLSDPERPTRLYADSC